MTKARSGVLSTQKIALLGVFIAMTVVLSRVLRIDLGFSRFSLSSVCSIMAGLWLGPLYGALSGAVADLLGSFLQGYAPNPLITASAAMWGFLPGIMATWAVKCGKPRKIRVARLCLTVLLTALVCSMGLTYLGLVMIGYDYRAIFVSRLLQFAVMTPVYAVLVCCLYFSPVTSFLGRLVHESGR